MIKDIISDIKVAAKENKHDLFTRLIDERLQLALKTYYKDLNSKFEQYTNYIETNTLLAAKKLIR